ncbi:MAG: aminotransferase class I/II-fold pyridoxal phosphate-dependent enzyme, partial [Burkholderiaceae bacterium]
IAALTGDQSCVERFGKTFETRRDLTVAALRAIPGLDIATPDGAFYAYVSCKALLGRRTPDGRTIASDREFVAYLLDRAHVATVSGTGFLHSPYFRLSFAASTENLGLALQRIRQAVLDLRDS